MEIRNNLFETRYKLRKLWIDNNKDNFRMLDVIRELDDFIYTFDKLIDTRNL